MKKLALSLAVVFAVGMVSCGGHKDDKVCDSDTCAAPVEEVAVAGEEVANDTDTVVVAEVAEAPAEAPAETPAN